MPLPPDAAWLPNCLNVFTAKRKEQANFQMAVHHAVAGPFRPPSQFKILLLGGYLSGKHTDSLKDVETDLDS